MFSSDLIIIYLFIAGILAMLVSGVVFCVKGKKNSKKSQTRLGITLIVILAAVILCMIALHVCMSIALSPDCEKDIAVKSPDGEYELIIREWQAMGGSGAYVYMKEGFFKKKVGRLTFDDYSMPFKDGLYEIKWEDDYVTVKYYSGVGDARDPDDWKSETFELP